jgi:phosphoglycerate dehydrogenase-like enzyme
MNAYLTRCGDLWTAPAQPDAERTKPAHFPGVLTTPHLCGLTVETIRKCANDVDRLWMPIHESNQRTN